MCREEMDRLAYESDLQECHEYAMYYEAEMERLLAEELARVAELPRLQRRSLPTVTRTSSAATPIASWRLVVPVQAERRHRASRCSQELMG